MNKSALLLILVLVLAVGCQPTPTSTPVPPPTSTPVPPPPKVLLIAKAGAFAMDLMLTEEVGVMKSMLEKTGFQVIVASATGQLIRGESTTLKPDIKLADVKVEDYAGFIVPCMAIDTAPPETVEVVKKANALGKPIAAQNGSVILIMSKAGLLSGKQFAVGPGYERYIPEGVYRGTGVVQDGNLLTSGSCPYMATASHPDTTVELTRKFISLLASTR